MPDSILRKCACCGYIATSERIPKGWYVMADGTLTCSRRCADEAHAEWKQHQLDLAFAVLRDDQRREELGIAR